MMGSCNSRLTPIKGGGRFPASTQLGATTEGRQNDKGRPEPIKKAASSAREAGLTFKEKNRPRSCEVVNAIIPLVNIIAHDTSHVIASKTAF